MLVKQIRHVVRDDGHDDYYIYDDDVYHDHPNDPWRILGGKDYKVFSNFPKSYDHNDLYYSYYKNDYDFWDFANDLKRLN